MKIINIRMLLEAVSGVSFAPIKRQERVKQYQTLPNELLEIAFRESNKPEFSNL